MMYGSPCKFLGICSGHDTPESDNWRKLGRVHQELPLPADGRDILTNSRIRCFQTCRRKHFYQYELGIERQDDEEKETLYFGRLWHAALEAWFSFDLEKENYGNRNSDSSANSVETAAVA
jgi:ATP-dependent helicase/DNAse subunit B